MKSDLDHLPEKQQAELVRARSILLDEFDAARKRGAGGTSDWRKGGEVQKIILFGSYARNDWVDEPDNGYLSDFDLLVIVSHPKLTDIADYWWVAEDKILRDPAIERTVNIIVHTLTEVNQGLSRGEYFWTDIHRDGVVLYELPGHPLAEPKPPTKAEALEMAQRYFEARWPSVDEWLEIAKFAEAKGSVGDWQKKSAFGLHQAVEAAYACFLLVQTFYFPRSHNIKFLRSLAENADKALAEAWPRDAREARRRFELLKRAYVEARYSDRFNISEEDLRALTKSAELLRDLVRSSVKARIAQLAAA